MNDYALISNRGPNFSNGALLHRAAGGSADAYRLLMRTLCQSWTCISSSELCRPEHPIISDYNERLNVVGLEETLYQDYYYKFVSECLHPLLLGWPDKVRSIECEAALHSATERVADSVLGLHTSGRYIIGDYHLYRLPRLLHEAKHIMLFWFIPFLEYSLENKIVQDIVYSLSFADDLIFLHPHYADNYRSCYERLMGKKSPVRLHSITLGADEFFSTSCFDDFNSFQRIVQKNFGAQRFDGRRFLLSICRLDFAKSVPTLLAAFDQFIQTEDHDDVDLLLALPPHRPGSLLYVEEEKLIRSLLCPLLKTGRVHVAWEWMSRTEMQVLYKFADAFAVPSRHDGMPLTPFEYALSNNGHGSLILSDGIGAHFIMGQDAFSFTRDDATALADALSRGLSAPLSERSTRIKRLKINAHAVGIDSWYNSVAKLIPDPLAMQISVLSVDQLYDALPIPSLHRAS
jgi:trehalose-6-phosphate synthase